jgi:DNA-binding NtrC family response regulator
MMTEAERLTILIVDDEKNIREGLSKALQLAGYATRLADSGGAAVRELEQATVDLVVTDLKMPGLPGEQLLKRVVSSYPTVPVIILTGHGTIKSAVEAMQAGAYDFLTKPVSLDRLELLVKRALSRRQLVLENLALQRELQRRSSSSQVVAASHAMKKVFEVVEQVAPTRASVLITGESGVGKEVVADTIHSLSPRSGARFVKVHCAALSEALLESELFGHERGAFTGAVARRRGRFELADGGTIFLDEIGEISQNVQIKLLRVLQERTFERVGGEDTITVDVRLITATNRDLKADIDRGSFREDLYYRLNVVHVEVPSLRERQADIPLLAAGFLKEASEENGKALVGIEPAALTALQRYSWPGNARELRNSIESAVVMARGTTIDLGDLPAPVRNAEDDAAAVRVAVGSTLAHGERELIRATLNSQNGNKSRAAEILGISRKTLLRKLREYGLAGPYA